MVRLLVSYTVSAIIVVLFFTMMYSAVFETYSGGSFDAISWKSDTMELLYWPVVLKLLLGLAFLYLIVVLPLTWISNRKFSNKKMITAGLFILIGVFVAGIGLTAIEPIIATDYFEYGERQELNKVLEAIGYDYANVMVYLCAFLVALGTWAITQVQLKKIKD